MTRPLLSRILPNRFKPSLYYRHYHSRHDVWRHLFKAAPLALCSGVSMYDLIPGDVISGNLAFNGFYEWDLTRRIAEHATNGKFLVDVGANMGYFSLLWAGLSKAGRVIAFEAAPRNIGLFQNNIERNQLEDRITLIPKAAGDHAGTVTFDAGPADQSGWGGISATPSATTITIPMVRIDEELPDTKIDVLKIDVEGADTWVLFGCERLLKSRRIQTIYFEQNPHRMERLGIVPGDAQKFLQNIGYEYHPMGADDSTWIAYPHKA
jgi:FkbM family methyltransferase